MKLKELAKHSTDNIFAYENNGPFRKNTKGITFKNYVVRGMVAELKARKGEHEHQIRVIDSYLPELEKWLKELVVCDNCSGRGEYSYFHAHDDVETKTCESCKGTGIK